MRKLSAFLLLALSGAVGAGTLPLRLGAPIVDVVNGGTAAADATLANNTACTSLTAASTPQGWYFELGNASGPLYQRTVGAGMTSTTSEVVASATKMQSEFYFVKKFGGYSSLTTAQKNALSFIDGYATMGDLTTGQTCPSAGNGYACTDSHTPTPGGSVNACLTYCSGAASTSPPIPAGSNFNATLPAAVGVFDYDSGHLENLGGTDSSINSLGYASIYSHMLATMGLTGQTDGVFNNQPLLAGALATTALHYAVVLRWALTDSQILGAIGQNQVTAYCTDGTHVGPSYCAGATHGPSTNGVLYSPILNSWVYGIGGWGEQDTSAADQWEISSPGAFGTYPFLIPTCTGGAHPPFCTSQAEFNASGVFTYYGILFRVVPGGSGTGPGQKSYNCASLLRAAYFTGNQQLGATPTF